jgi:hypothetical protein
MVIGGLLATHSHKYQVDGATTRRVEEKSEYIEVGVNLNVSLIARKMQ